MFETRHNISERVSGPSSPLPTSKKIETLQLTTILRHRILPTPIFLQAYYM